MILLVCYVEKFYFFLFVFGRYSCFKTAKTLIFCFFTKSDTRFIRNWVVQIIFSQRIVVGILIVFCNDFMRTRLLSQIWRNSGNSECEKVFLKVTLNGVFFTPSWCVTYTARDINVMVPFSLNYSTYEFHCSIYRYTLLPQLPDYFFLRTNLIRSEIQCRYGKTPKL